MNIFNHKPRKCPACKGERLVPVLISHGETNGGKLVVNQGYTLCGRCRGVGVLSPILDKYTAQELVGITKGKAADDIIDDLVSGVIPKK